MLKTARWQDIQNDKEKYQAYLCSREWGVLKEAVRERSGGTCERCRTLPQDATHHLTYERKYAESIDDLQAICTPCHEFTHGKSGIDPVVNMPFIQWLSQQECTPWMDWRWGKSWIRGVFGSGVLIPVLQLWITRQVSDYGADNAVAQLEDDHEMREIGYCPTNWEIRLHKTLPADELSFWSWLSHGCPSQEPSTREAFNACVLLAQRLSEEKHG